MFKKLTLLAAVWTFCLIVLGAYVRLSDAGLGCPDWPGCYGKVTPHHAIESISAAHAEQPHGPVSLAKAWKEMVHRYFASTLGFLILVLMVLAVRQRRKLRQSPALPVATFFVVCFQGALGAWTVTMLLKPAIVTSHLIGGMTLLAMLVWLTLRQRDWSVARPELPDFRLQAFLGLVILSCQIILGGWVSTNYAALACTDFPSCQGSLLPTMDFNDAFHVLRELGQAPDGSMLTMANLTAIHWLHRVGALITFCYLIWLSWRLYRQKVLRGLVGSIVVALVLQVSLGIGNVVLHLPLPVAVLHNAGAALLLVLLVCLNFRLASGRPAPMVPQPIHSLAS
ncbi:COX15/CtaA family protein [Chitinimonas sp. BJB300]|uniref:COX15/CtaA family protein n=1 Tax=Chitinimonas sp. BJB300 TaxID=1559339 RepID=UPI000C0CD161|nr:COX15/CtaA family protein [Chitinimonas sp. BJB300]PHV11615.1 heme A synthase [Chitinimonas sp. BJB300]TSJ88103.1 heme A synthase [Chitinimonas sp. BJB300]